VQLKNVCKPNKQFNKKPQNWPGMHGNKSARSELVMRKKAEKSREQNDESDRSRVLQRSIESVT
jgi:hypothetical protein